MIKTEKIYYDDLYLTTCIATVVEVSEMGIVCDQTVAFPEGGGQQADKGCFLIEDNFKQSLKILFLNVKKGVGDVFLEQDFPTISVNTPIYHYMEVEYLRYFKVGMKVKICIDVERRARLTISHTAIHLVLMAIDRVRKGIITYVKGADIREDLARLDFFIHDKLNDDEIMKITECVNELILNDYKIETYAHVKQKEAVYWKCLDYVCACGGTHLPSTKYIGNVRITKKSKGKNLQRITIEFPNHVLPMELYHKD